MLDWAVRRLNWSDNVFLGQHTIEKFGLERILKLFENKGFKCDCRKVKLCVGSLPHSPESKNAPKYGYVFQVKGKSENEN